MIIRTCTKCGRDWQQEGNLDGSCNACGNTEWIKKETTTEIFTPCEKQDCRFFLTIMIQDDKENIFAIETTNDQPLNICLMCTRFQKRDLFLPSELKGDG